MPALTPWGGECGAITATPPPWGVLHHPDRPVSGCLKLSLLRSVPPLAAPSLPTPLRLQSHGGGQEMSRHPAPMSPALGMEHSQEACNLGLASGGIFQPEELDGSRRGVCSWA